MNEIVALAIHDLNRTNDGFEARLSNKLLPRSDAAEDVIETLSSLYNRRTSKSHGRFTTAEGSPTQGQVRDYVEKRNDFIRLTGRMMKNLAAEAGKKAASGGHVFFAHFRREGSDYLLVTIVADKVSAALTKKRNIGKVEHLDLDGFRFAGRINLSAWAASEERYLSFLKGKGTVADYFRDFLGCDTAVHERKDTQDLVAALKAFVVAENMAEADGTAFLRRAMDILSRSNKLKETVEFESFSNELTPKQPDKLIAYLADSGRRLNEGFVPNAGALKDLVRLKGKTKMWTVEFDRDAIGKNVVRFNAETNSLTLFHVPSDLVDQMREEGMINA